jgi:hypothetical protein
MMVVGHLQHQACNRADTHQQGGRQDGHPEPLLPGDQSQIGAAIACEPRKTMR